MHKLAVIGSRGLIGQELLKCFKPDLAFNSDNINTISKFDIETIICAAPTGDRRFVDQNPDLDRSNIDNLIVALQQANFKKIIQISTIDTICYPDSVYGKNRKFLENFIQGNFENSHVIRLCSLIGLSIKKNILYDLKHNQYVQNINLSSELQWYPLSCLEQHINMVVNNRIRDITLVSEPISNKTIVEKFFNQIPLVGTDPGPVKKYNVSPYCFSQDEIFKHISDYLAK